VVMCENNRFLIPSYVEVLYCTTATKEAYPSTLYDKL